MRKKALFTLTGAALLGVVVFAGTMRRTHMSSQRSETGNETYVVDNTGKEVKVDTSEGEKVSDEEEETETFTEDWTESYWGEDPDDPDAEDASVVPETEMITAAHDDIDPQEFTEWHPTQGNEDMLAIDESMSYENFQVKDVPEEVLKKAFGGEINGSNKRAIYDGIQRLGYANFSEAVYVRHKLNPFDEKGAEHLLYIALKINNVFEPDSKQERYVTVIVDIKEDDVKGVLLNLEKKGKFKKYSMK